MQQIVKYFSANELSQTVQGGTCCDWFQLRYSYLRFMVCGSACLWGGGGTLTTKQANLIEQPNVSIFAVFGLRIVQGQAAAQADHWQPQNQLSSFLSPMAAACDSANGGEPGWPSGGGRGAWSGAWASTCNRQLARQRWWHDDNNVRKNIMRVSRHKNSYYFNMNRHMSTWTADHSICWQLCDTC